MKFDVRHTDGCGQTFIDSRPSDDHSTGDRITIKCQRCGRVGECEILAPLQGLEDENADGQNQRGEQERQREGGE